jgi:hypothetical protein
MRRLLQRDVADTAGGLSYLLDRGVIPEAPEGRSAAERHHPTDEGYGKQLGGARREEATATHGTVIAWSCSSQVGGH